MMKRFIKNAGLLRDDRSGAALILVSLALPMIFGMAAFAVDMGYMYYINSRLQNAADIAALAGGTRLVAGDKTAVETQALAYVKVNLPGGWDVLDKDGKLISGTGKATVKITPKIEALCSIKLRDAGLPCYAAPGLTYPINYLSVSLDASTPLFFTGGLGFKTASLSSDSIVTADGSTMPPLNVAVILDTTYSMTTDTTTACGGVRMTKLACAKQAALGMLGTLWPVVDQVALYTYPGVSQEGASTTTPDSKVADANAAKDICASGTPVVSDYKKDAIPAKYQIVDFADDYRDKNAPPRTLKDPTKPLVQALDSTATAAGSTTKCKGLQVGKDRNNNYIYTFYADAIEKAQEDLVAANIKLGENRQNVIVILSDGDANSPTTFIEPSRQKDQCLQAINAARAATDSGTWVYSLAYNANQVAGPRVLVDSCNYDTSTAETVTVTRQSYSVTYTNTYRNGSCRGFTAGNAVPTGLPRTTTEATPGPAVGSKTNQVNGTQTPAGNCSKNNTPVRYTQTYDEVTEVSNPTTYDRSACDTMRQLASSPDKFFSVDTATSGGCVSDANPNTTDLLAIFKRVAISMMTKRRAPKSAI